MSEVNFSDVVSPDNLAGLKDIDLRLTGRLQDVMYNHKADVEESAMKYLGSNSRSTLRSYLMKDEEGTMFLCLAEWYCFHYRPRKKAPTQAERLLAGPLPVDERLMLESRNNAAVSLFKLEKLDPKAGTILFYDLISDKRAEVRDKMMSQSAEPNITVPSRIYSAGNFFFSMPLGPPMRAGQVGDAAMFLMKKGLQFSPEGMSARAYLFGHLWKWQEKEFANMSVQVQNPDGELIKFHTVTYTVINRKKVKRGLMQRNDLEYDPEGEEFSLVGGTSRMNPIGKGANIYGALRFEGKYLIAEIDSEEKLISARKWLDSLAGLEFKSMKVKPVEDLYDQEHEVSSPLKSANGKKRTLMFSRTTFASMEEAQAAFVQYYYDWLDLPIPMFQGKTPREMCRTEQGKRVVAIMIRSMDNPEGMGAVKAPTQDLLRELGLNESADGV